MTDRLRVREACRRAMPLDGTDAQALEHALTITEQERDAAYRAVKYLLDRAQTDADTGYQIGPGTEAHHLLYLAEAAVTSRSLANVEAARSSQHWRSEPRIRELWRRVRELEDGT